MQHLPGRHASLSPAKRALLEHWASGGRSAEDVPIEPRSRTTGPVPLSFLQERQLFLEALTPGTAVNNISVCIRLAGALDLGRLARCAHRILDRHEVLRTSFDIDHGVAVATISPRAAIDVPLEDLELLGAGAFAEAIRSAREHAEKPFDLSRPPLLRIRAYRLSPLDHLLHIVIHHTIGDGWSLGVLLRDLFDGYSAGERGGSAEPSPLPIQYADFAEWQRRSVKSPLLDRQLHYWKSKLAGELPSLELPADRPRPAKQSFRGATRRFRLASGTAEMLKKVGREHQVTPFMILGSAFGTLLSRFSGQEDVLIGMPIAGRPRPETEGMIGAFINTIVLRTDLSGEPTFLELLGRVRDVALDAFAHQELPFEKVVAELRPERDPSRSPIFQAMFNLQNSPIPDLRIPGLSIELIPMDRNTSPVDLTLIMNESPTGLEGAFEYSTDLFDASTIDRLSDSFERLLEDAVGHPERRISKLAIMSEAERRHLVLGLNDTRAEYPREQGVAELFEDQVRRTPGKTALIAGTSELTYGELDSWADRLADELKAAGVGPGVRVGVFTDRSPCLLAALLAVLKAGGAYVPIDPTLPPDRVEFMLKDAGTRALMTEEDRHLTKALEGIVLCPIGEREGVSETQAQISRRADASPARPEDPAYLIYTSGSTGQPKGVIVRRDALVNVLWSMKELIGIRPVDRLLAVTSVSFDIAALELFMPLVAGATVVLADRETTSDRRKLEAEIEGRGITLMQATPSAWRMLLAGEWRGRAQLTALSGGEPLTRDLADQLLGRVGSLWNLYGPTETTVWSSACRIRPGPEPITVGRPIANTQCYILDSRLEPVPPGVTGDLYIGGDGLAIGYLNRPAMTAERFIPDPFAPPEGTGGRLYRTGDRARLRPDGSFQLLGRVDRQVKIHGFRIELAEIEAVLGRHPALSAVAVVPREGAEGGRHLVAYVVPVADAAADPGLLRDFLRSLLPAYMVPAVFVFLKELPLTRAGKIDFKSLPAAAPPSVATACVAPATQLEELLASTVAKVLGVDRVGVEDNFFDLGGGSIQILEVIVRAREMGCSLTPELFFEHQTIRALAHFVERGRRDA